MPRRHPRQTCKVCGGHRDDVGDMSARGKCQGCATRIQREALTEISEHRGPTFDRWRERVAAGVGGVLPDKPPAEVG